MCLRIRRWRLVHSTDCVSAFGSPAVEYALLGPKQWLLAPGSIQCRATVTSGSAPTQGTVVVRQKRQGLRPSDRIDGSLRPQSGQGLDRQLDGLGSEVIHCRGLVLADGFERAQGRGIGAPPYTQIDVVT